MKNMLEGKKTVLFQGDSITDCGRKREDAADLGFGYPANAAALWKSLYPAHGINFLNRGVSGDRTIELLARYEKDVAALKPDLISILIGINDTWRRYDCNDPTTTEAFEKNYRCLLENIKRDLPGTSIVIIEPFLLGSDPGKQWRGDLDPKIHAVRNLAMEFADAFIPMDGIFASYAVNAYKETEMAGDGVHPSPVGNAIIAAEWLRALGAL